jgi:formylglycine-generating enzyme required for sulfatase activity
VRYAAGQALGKIGDPRFDHIEPTMVTVPAGEFIMGSDKYDEGPQHRVTLPEFRIGKYPVTNAEYKRFIDETQHPVPFVDSEWFESYNWDPQKRTFPEERANHPVVWVSWYDAKAYCEWLSQKTGKRYRLPTEAEWEKAARGTDAREYPWGDEFDQRKCNTSESGIHTTTPVGIYAEGASPYGALDMAGNVWEWCNSRLRGYPYRADDGRENPPMETKPSRGLLSRLLKRESRFVDVRVARGGSWHLRRGSARCAARYGSNPDYRYYLIGFRVAES